MPRTNKTRKARKCSLANKKFKEKYHNGIDILYTIDDCKKIYEVTEDSIKGAFIIRKLSNKKIIMERSRPSSSIYNNPGKTQTPNNSMIFSDSILGIDGNWTYVGHQVFKFTTLKKDLILDLFAPLTPSGMLQPYAVSKKYVYLLRDKVAVPIKSINLTKDVYAQAKNLEKIPFTVEMIDSGF